MAVIVGSDGAVQIDLGNGLKYMANIKSWRARLGRDLLDKTTQADDSKKRTAGLADWTGDFAFNLEFSDDVSVALSAWQMLEFALSGRDDELKADVALILQRYGILPDCNIFQTSIPGVIRVTGTVVIGDIAIDCEDPEQPLVLVASWGADGALTPERD